MMDTDGLIAALTAQTGLHAGGLAELGLGAGPHPVVFFQLDQLDAGAADRLIADHVGEDLLAVVPDAYVQDADGRRRWTRSGLAPIAIVGVAETFERGPTLADALPAAAILLLDRSSSPPSVLGWDRLPEHRLVTVAAALEDLDLRD